MPTQFDPTPNPFTITVSTVIKYHILCHFAFIYMVFTGTLTEWLIAIGIYVVKSNLGSVIYHRLLSHKSFIAPKWFEYGGTIFAIAGGNSSTLAWVAFHRAHHRYSDQPKDPHSPTHIGYLNVQFKNFLNAGGADLRYAPDLLRSKFHYTLHMYHWLFTIGFITLLYLIDPRAVIYAWFVPALLLWHGARLVNSLNHSPFGYRNHDTQDLSVNNLITGYLVGGEGWHNNHHADPSKPKYGEKWWEFDPGWYIIKLVRLDK